MIIPTTVSEQIQNAVNAEVSYRKLHEHAIVVNNQSGDTIRISITSILDRYRFILDEYIYQYTIPEDEFVRYRFNPKMLSYDLYDTTEYWFLLLAINNCVSKIDFTNNTVKIIDPKSISEFVNEVMILEDLID
jgi:hypothetical protein